MGPLRAACPGAEVESERGKPSGAHVRLQCCNVARISAPRDAARPKNSHLVDPIRGAETRPNVRVPVLWANFGLFGPQRRARRFESTTADRRCRDDAGQILKCCGWKRRETGAIQSVRSPWAAAGATCGRPRAGALSSMPTVSDERKLVVEQCLGKMSIEEIRKHTGPDGVFPRVAAPMASSTVRALKRRIEEHGDVLHRKQRVDKATLSVAERQHISATFAGPAARAKTTTAQLGQQLLAEGFSYHGRSATGTFPPSTLNDAARSMNLSYKQLTPQPLGVNGWQRVLQHQLADQYPARWCAEPAATSPG